jgi:hypothetical protein
MSESEDAAMKSNDEVHANQPGWELPRGFKSIEARLATLSPRDDRLDRERLMFLAGQASVEPANGDRYRELNTWKNIRTWQAAFAGMTAIAASLVALIVLRPVAVESQTAHLRNLPATQISVPKLPAGHVRSPLSNTVLSARDVLHQNIERLIVKKESHSLDGETTIVLPGDSQAPPVLTPAAWMQVFDSSASSAAPTNGSSDLPVHRGVTS